MELGHAPYQETNLQPIKKKQTHINNMHSNW